VKIKTVILAAAVCVPCVEWTRLSGKVKAINLRDSTVTIQNNDGDLLTVPVDYQVKVMEKHDELRGLKNLALDEKIILLRTLQEKPADDSAGLQPPEPSQH